MGNCNFGDWRVVWPVYATGEAVIAGVSLQENGMWYFIREKLHFDSLRVLSSMYFWPLEVKRLLLNFPAHPHVTGGTRIFIQNYGSGSDIPNSLSRPSL